MKRLKKILVPTDLSERSRRALLYGCWLAGEDNAALVVLHVASEFDAWEFCSEEWAFAEIGNKPWPLDRVLVEATLDLNRYLEQHLEALKRLPNATKRVVLGPVPQRIASIADEEKADLIIMSPRRERGMRHFLSGGITDRVTRLSPCPVLSVTPPLPSRPWRGKLAPLFFGWPRQRTAEI
jgi:nucleotide-binding universal stress UspA family protein